MSRDVDGLSDEIRSFVWAMTRRFRLEAEEVADLSLAQQNVLARLDRTPGMTGAELARSEAVRPQSMTKTVASLREAGLVEASVSALDARRHELALTAAGADVLVRIRRLRHDWLAERLDATLDAAEMDRVADGLAVLRRVVDATPRR
ncbi:MarR family transcriptional regulator [Tersicoccus sp. MR15.9]|uniref:MarR family winged helix-turn-helix transcriptional regulator n=1 Tax=Tersicoccus mangrovi TaxID=3121635 RepID=UPI002FE5D1F7